MPNSKTEMRCVELPLISYYRNDIPIMYNIAE